MDSVLHDIVQGLRSASLLDQTNLVLGIIGVWLMIRRNLWAFPIGLVAVSVQGVLFWQARFYADALLQLFFAVLLAYGWWHWTHPDAKRVELPVTAESWRLRVILLGATTVLWLLAGLASDRFTDATLPFRDAFIAAFSVSAQWLQARKKLENWPVWIAVNAVAVWSYAVAGITYTAFLYAVYLVLALVGWREWRQAYRRGRA